ncbi:exodeoxyribonuclease VII small subunit [Pedobacter sp. CAN_A7]|uniref:exodeoxyribonuclease VII small subunit n=1 Tax=Pedobacter sp. CAN_A7 TaxID=2787722 RepID=UPI0018C9C956
METNMTYESAYKELTAIANEIETESISVDILAEKVKRASDLILFCQEKLRSTEEEVGRIIKNITSTDD